MLDRGVSGKAGGDARLWYEMTETEHQGGAETWDASAARSCTMIKTHLQDWVTVGPVRRVSRHLHGP